MKINLVQSIFYKILSLNMKITRNQFDDFWEDQEKLKQREICKCDSEIRKTFKSFTQKRKKGEKIEFERLSCYPNRYMTRKTRDSYCESLKRKIFEINGYGFYDVINIKYKESNDFDNTNKCYVEMKYP